MVEPDAVQGATALSAGTIGLIAAVTAGAFGIVTVALTLLKEQLQRKRANGDPPKLDLSPDVKEAIFDTHRETIECHAIHKMTDPEDGRRLIFAPSRWGRHLHDMKQSLQVLIGKAEQQAISAKEQTALLRDIRDTLKGNG